MGPAVELFILMILGLAGVVGGLLFFTRPFWKRAANTLVETDRHEREILEEQARERAEEAECRRRAEEELHRALKGEEVPRPAAVRQQTAKLETNAPCEEAKTDRVQAGERQ